MQNEYRFQKTGIEEQTEKLKYIICCGLIFFSYMRTFNAYYSECAENRIFGFKQAKIFLFLP